MASSDKEKKNVLLDTLLHDTTETSTEVNELDRFLTRKPTAGQSAKVPPKDRGYQKKRKITHYLSPDTLDRLERLIPEVRGLQPSGTGKTISRSALLETALLSVIHDFEARGEHSLLAEWSQDYLLSRR